MQGQRFALSGIPASLRLCFTVAGWVCITSLAAQASFNMPANPVPLTLQTAAVLACGLLCSPKTAALSMASYVLCGLLGAPVFAGFVGGPLVALMPSFGYLLAFVIAAPLMSKLSRDGSNRVGGPVRIFASAIIAHAIVLALGASYLKVVIGSEWSTAIALGVVPFVLGSVVKSAVVAALPAR